MIPLYTELLLNPKVILASPKPAFANAVLSFTDIGGRSALAARHTNFKVHVAFRLDFGRELPEERARFALFPWLNSLRCSAATEADRQATGEGFVFCCTFLVLSKNKKNYNNKYIQAEPSQQPIQTNLTTESSDIIIK